jgi:hypothetical protein
VNLRTVSRIKASGPDCYLQNHGFGKAVFISFPPVLVFYSDNTPDDPAIINDPQLWEQYLEINTQDREIQRRKHIRDLLRAIDGRTVQFQHTQMIQKPYQV